MTRRFIEDESGMTMALTIMVMVIIGVMGAGLLTFVTTDLRAVAEVNQGQRAFEMADAGVQAAKQQLNSDFTVDHYNGGTGDINWSSSTSNSSCPDLGSYGTCLNNLDSSDSTSDSVNVQIQSLATPANSFKVISTGGYGNAKRKIEAVFQVTPGISSNIPPAHFTWRNINQDGGGGGCNLDGTSMFAIGDASFGDSFDICDAPDRSYGKWAATSGAGPYPNSVGSYPNAFNSTPRSSCPGGRAGIVARGTISTNGGAGSEVAKGTCSFDENTTPAVVSGPPANGNQIAFPFSVASSPPASDLEVLRQRALQLEKQNPGARYYIDSDPGNGVDDAALTSDYDIGSSANSTRMTWPAGSDFETVVFFKFLPNSGRNASWTYSQNCASTDTSRGVIAVENGNFNIDNNNGGFNGAVVIRGGKFSSSGNACMTGYVNSSGDINMRGDFTSGTVPSLASLPAFQSSDVSLLSWREVYQ